MSDLEHKAKSLLTDVIVNGKQTVFGAEDMMFLAAYAFKNAIRKNLKNKVAEDVRMCEYVDVVQWCRIGGGLRIARIRAAGTSRVALE